MPLQHVLVHDELEELVALHGDHGDALQVAPVQVRVGLDVDLPQPEGDAGPHALDGRAGVVAQVTAAAAVQDDLRSHLANARERACERARPPGASARARKA